MADTVENPIDQQLINVTRTCYSAYLQTSKYLGLTPFRILPHTTLNEKFNIQSGVAPAVGESPNVRYLVIGNMGHYTIKADDGSDETANVLHRSNDAALYNGIPFVVREPNDDYRQIVAVSIACVLRKRILVNLTSFIMVVVFR